MTTIAKEVAKRMRATLDSERKRAERDFKEREAAIAANAEQEAKNASAVAKAQEQDRRNKANYRLSRRLEDAVGRGEVSSYIPTVQERTEWTAEYGADMQAIVRACSAQVWPWLGEEDVFRPVLVNRGDGAQLQQYCPDILPRVLGALARMHENKVRDEQVRAEKERQERANRRALELADLSDAEWQAMRDQQRRLEA